MNGKRIFFSALITSIIGFVIGLGIAKIDQSKKEQFENSIQTDNRLLNTYTLLGAGVGFFVGAGQEYLRQAKIKQEQNDDLDTN